jgi:DNA-binding CsgD family transcriptional regulator
VPLLARALAWRAACLDTLNRLPEAFEDGRHALTLARQLADPAGEAYALYSLAGAAWYTNDIAGAEDWLRQAQRIDRAAIPGWIARHLTMQLAAALGETGEADDAQWYCADALAQAREAGALFDQGDCLRTMADLDLRAGRLAATRAHLREALKLYSQTSESLLLLNCLFVCADLCAVTRRWRETITAWAATDAVHRAMSMEAFYPGPEGERRQRSLQQARAALGPALARAAEQRGGAMTLATAAEYALLLVTEEPDEPAAAPGLQRLSARERELVILVAQGRTNAQIAAQLSVSVRAVRSHLDRIRGKTGSRRRADLTRLALQAGLV